MRQKSYNIAQGKNGKHIITYSQEIVTKMYSKMCENQSKSGNYLPTFNVLFSNKKITIDQKKQQNMSRTLYCRSVILMLLNFKTVMVRVEG